MSLFTRAANEPTTLPLPFPDWPREVAADGELPDGAANEPPATPPSAPSGLGTSGLRAPRFDFDPAWRNQAVQIERQRLFDQLAVRWRAERRQRTLEAMLVAQPEHELPWRPYGDPTPRPAAS